MVDSNTRRNVISYYVNFVVMALAGLIVNPLLLGVFGPVAFGLWKSLQRFLDFATLADGRASQALKWIVASRTTQPDQERRRDVAAAVIVWLRFLPAVLLISAAVTAAIPLLIRNIPEDYRHLAYLTAAILAANTVLFGLLSIPDSVLMGVNLGYRSMTITTVVFIATNGAMVGAAFAGWALWSLALITLLGTVINASITLIVAKRKVPWWGVAQPSRPDIRRVFGYSSWTLGSAVVDKLFVSSELIVISVMLGATAVTEYTFTTFAMQFVLSIAMVSASGFMPLLGSYLGSSDTRAAADRARSVRHLVIGIAALGSSALLAFNELFVSLWVDDSQYMGDVLNALLVVCGLQFMLIRMDGQILDVTMRIGPKVLLGLSTSIGGIGAGLTCFAITSNLEASLIAIIAIRLIGNVAFPILVARSIPGSGVALRPVALATAVLGMSFVLGTFLTDLNTTALFSCVIAWILASAIAGWCGLLPRSIVRSLITGRNPD